MDSKADIHNRIQQSIARMFELPTNEITPNARLYEDLDIDSLDAVDLVIELRQQTGLSLAPEKFRKVRTVGDITDTLYALGVDSTSTAPS